METKTKPERVKWRLKHTTIVTDDDNFVVADTLRGKITGPEARQIVHEHNTWGELLEAVKIALNNAKYGLDRKSIPVLEAAIAAAEKESCKP